MKKKRRIAWILIMLLLIFIVAWQKDLTLREHHSSSSKIQEEIRLLLVTDLHSCHYGEKQRDLLQAIDHQKPHVILLGGDIIDDQLPENKAYEFLQGIARAYPSYYVSGNHEYWSGKADIHKERIRALGIKLLQGDCLMLTIGGRNIQLCGLDDPEVGETRWQKQWDRIKEGETGNLYRILLSHRPERIETYLLGDFDLILTGHTHGGQWRIPGLLNGLYAPDQGFFPKYAGGVYEFDQSTMIVSRGLALESTKIPRIFNPPELWLIHLKPTL